MSAAMRLKARTPVPAVDLVRASCTICRAPRALCASVRDRDVDVCFLCALSMAQLVASAQRASERPHDKPCCCETCVTFDEGQRGELANVTLLDDEHTSVSRWRVLEVD